MSLPRVQVFRRPTAGPARPSSPAPSPTAAPPARPAPPPAPTAAPPARPAPPDAQVQRLAHLERVPVTAARAALQGGPTCAAWREANPAEACALAERYALAARARVSPEVAAEALATGNPEAFLAERCRQAEEVAAARLECALASPAAAVRRARRLVPGAAVEAALEQLQQIGEEVALVLERVTVLGQLLGLSPYHVTVTGHRVARLAVVALGSREAWQALAGRLELDAALAEAPLPVAREPSARPVLDPRPFLALVGQRLRLVLRNGLVLVPVHSVARWGVGQG